MIVKSSWWNPSDDSLSKITWREENILNYYYYYLIFVTHQDSIYINDFVYKRLLDKLTVAHLLTTFPAFYGTQISLLLEDQKGITAQSSYS